MPGPAAPNAQILRDDQFPILVCVQHLEDPVGQFLVLELSTGQEFLCGQPVVTIGVHVTEYQLRFVSDKSIFDILSLGDEAVVV